MDKNTIWMIIFITLSYVFRSYFTKIFYKHLDVSKIEKIYIIYPLMSILFITILSKYIYGTGTFILESVSIYNYYQYYALVFVLLLGSSIRLNWTIFIINYILAFKLSLITSNNMALIIVNIMALYYVVFKFTIYSFRRIIYFSTIITVVTLFTSYPILLIILYNEINIVAELINYSGDGIHSRYNNMINYILNLEWYNLIFPFLSMPRNITSSFHNELLEVFNSAGILGIVSYYSFIIMNIIRYSKPYMFSGLSILFVIFLAGNTVQSTLHSYTLIVLAYVMSFYYAASKQTNISAPRHGINNNIMAK